MNIKQYFEDFVSTAVKSEEQLKNFLKDSNKLNESEKHEIKKLWMAKHAPKPKPSKPIYEHKPREVSRKIHTGEED